MDMPTTRKNRKAAAAAAAKKRERQRANRAAYVARQTENGRRVWRTWATEEEICVYKRVKKNMPKLIELERRKEMMPDPESNTETPSAVDGARPHQIPDPTIARD